MISRLLLSILVLVLGNTFFAADFNVRIVNNPKEVLLGTPVQITVETQNVSGHAITIAAGHGGFDIQLSVRRADGAPRQGCPPAWTAQFKPGFTEKNLPAGWTKEWIRDISCRDEPGEWIIQAMLSSHGPYTKYNGLDPQDAFEAWQGEVRSAEEHIRLVRPTGLDAVAYQALKGDPLAHASDLLLRFPTSTYTGYVLAEKIPDYSNPLFHPIPPAEQACKSRDEGKTIVAFPDKSFEQYFKQLDAFVRGGRVPQSLRAELYGFYGDLLVQRGRFPEAESAFKEAVKTEPGDPKGKAYYHRAQDFLVALQGKTPTSPAQEK